MLTLERLDGTTYTLDNYMKIIDFNIRFPKVDTQKVSILGVDGYMDRGTRYEGRELSITANLIELPENFRSTRNQIFRIFKSHEEFYIIDSEEPGRRWLVKVSGGFDLPRDTPLFSNFTIELESRLSYAESISNNTSSNTTSTFTITNNGDTEVNPRKVNTPMTITITNISGGITIENLTTGDIWTYSPDYFISDNSEDWEQGSLGGTTGGEVDSSTRIRMRDFFPLAPGGTYTISIGTGYEFLFHEYDKDLNSINNHGWNSGTYAFTALDNTEVMRMVVKFSDGTSITPTDIEGSGVLLEFDVTIDGVKSMIGTQPVFNHTNGGLISLAPGSNDFQVTNMGADTQIDFEFKEYTI